MSIRVFAGTHPCRFRAYKRQEQPHRMSSFQPGTIKNTYHFIISIRKKFAVAFSVDVCVQII